MKMLISPLTLFSSMKLMKPYLLTMPAKLNIKLFSLTMVIGASSRFFSMMFLLNSLRRTYTRLLILLPELLFGDLSLIWLEMVNYHLKNILISSSMLFLMKLLMISFLPNSYISRVLSLVSPLKNTKVFWENVFSTSYSSIFCLHLLKTKIESLLSKISSMVLPELMLILLSSLLGIMVLIKNLKPLKLVYLFNGELLPLSTRVRNIPEKKRLLSSRPRLKRILLILLRTMNKNVRHSMSTLLKEKNSGTTTSLLKTHSQLET